MKYALYYKNKFIQTCEFPIEIKVLDKVRLGMDQLLIVESREFDLNALTIDLHLINIDEYNKEILKEL